MTLDGTIVSWNAGAERLYGYAEEEIIGHHASVLVPGGQASVVDGVIPRLLRGETIAPVEVVRQRRNGAVLNLALTFSPLHDENGESGNGKIVGLSCISRDITAQRQAEDALRESEVRLRYLSDAAFEGIAVRSKRRHSRRQCGLPDAVRVRPGADAGAGLHQLSRPRRPRFSAAKDSHWGRRRLRSPLPAP